MAPGAPKRAGAAKKSRGQGLAKLEPIDDYRPLMVEEITPAVRRLRFPPRPD